MKARLGISDRPIHHLSDFGMFVALNVMENDDEFLEGAKLLQGAFEVEAVKRAR